jgi:RNA polymerase sigma-70 factor (ECF subfamily)
MLFPDRRKCSRRGAIVTDFGQLKSNTEGAGHPLERLGARGGRADDLRLVAAILAGDDRAFLSLVKRHHRAMVRLAAAYVPPGAAEEVTQDAWIGVLKGLHKFEGRSSLKAWIFRILINGAQCRGAREARVLPFSALEADSQEPAVAEERFLDSEHPRWPGHWVKYPEPWSDERLISEETLAMVASAMEGLPRAQREVMRLRDIEGWTSAEVCEALEISEANQRVLLHRARSKVRQAIEPYMSGSGGKP